MEKDFISDVNVFNIQADIIRTLAKNPELHHYRQMCGRYSPAVMTNVISVYIEAPRAACVKSIMEKMHVSQKRGQLSDPDNGPVQGKNITVIIPREKTGPNPINYDMVLNSDRVGREKMRTDHKRIY